MLEFKITKGGQLFIKRGSKWKRQHCALSCAASDYMSGPTANCTDKCPLFGEPEQVPRQVWMSVSAKIPPTPGCETYVDTGEIDDRIQLCHGKYLVGTLIDERV